MEMILMVVVVMGVMYMLMIRPEKKRKNAQAEMRSSIAVGDEITTIGGIVGKVVNVRDEFITFETGEDRVRVRVAKWAVATKGKAAEEQADQVERKD